MATKDNKLGLIGLIGIVIGSMIGGGAYNVSQNAAAFSSAGAVLFAWLITGVGVLFLVITFSILASTRPELAGGLHRYAREGFGDYVGFNSAWSYWLSAGIGNVSFAVLLMDAFGYFFHVFGNGSNWISFIGGSILIWGFAILVLRGVESATLLNTISTVAKLVPLAVFVVVLIFAFNFHKLSFDFFGKGDHLGSVGTQIKAAMLVTLWCFVGVEGAVMMSGRAKKAIDVGRASVIGFIVSLVLYMVMSVLSFGIMSQSELAHLNGPSVAYVMEAIVGRWGAVLINLGVILSILGAWLAWTIITAEVPFDAAKENLLPKIFVKTNKKGAPVTALIINGVVMQLTLILSRLSNDAYLVIIQSASSIVVIPYVLTTFFIFKEGMAKGNAKYVFIGVVGSVYGFWMLFSSTPIDLRISSFIFAFGIIVYWWMRRKKAKEAAVPVFSPKEKLLAILLVIAALIALISW